MINYCFDYYKIVDNYCDDGTFTFDTEAERNESLKEMEAEGYTIASIYENEDCYCQARNCGECACGNFK